MLKTFAIATLASLALAFTSATAATRHHQGTHHMRPMMVMVNGHMAPVMVMINGHMTPVLVEAESANGQ